MTSVNSTAGDVFAAHVNEVKAAGVRFQGGIGAHPAQDLLRVREQGEDGRRRRRNLDLTLDHQWLSHRKPPWGRVAPRGKCRRCVPQFLVKLCFDARNL